eukprot:8347001-Pyramimonas_sp.AAC.2
MRVPAQRSQRRGNVKASPVEGAALPTAASAARRDARLGTAPVTGLARRPGPATQSPKPGLCGPTTKSPELLH